MLSRTGYFFAIVLVLLSSTYGISSLSQGPSLPSFYSAGATAEGSQSRIRVTEPSIEGIEPSEVNNATSLTASVGQPLTLSTSLFNFEASPSRFLLSLEVRSVEENGITYAVLAHTGLLSSYLQVEKVTLPWTPNRAGNYELRAFAVSYSNDNATGSSITGFSPIASRILTVEPSSVCLPSIQSTNLTPEAGSTNRVLPVQSVVGNAYTNPHYPYNAADGNLTTRWSTEATKGWIQLDLGRQSSLCSVEIAWYNDGEQGEDLTNSFTISTSQDGNRTVDVFVGKSGITGQSFQNYHIDEVEGRYVKISVYGSNENKVGSIAEVIVHGFVQDGNGGVVVDDSPAGARPALEIVSPLYGEAITGPPKNLAVNVNGVAYSGNGIKEVLIRVDRHSYEPAALENIGGNSTIWNISKAISVEGRHTITVKASDMNGKSSWETIPIDVLLDYETGQTDKFGIQKIYQTKENGEEWYMNMNNPFADSRFTSYATLTPNGDDSWRITDTKVRLDVATSSGFHPERIDTYDHGELARKGYMQDPNDWKNVEITGFVRVNHATVDDDSLSWYARGGRHTDSVPCEGSSYKNDLYYSGRMRVAKEQWHEGGYTFSEFSKGTSSLYDRWIGFKTVIYNTSEDSDSSVVIETWINENADKVTWKKVSTTTDSRNWGDEGDYCGGSPDQVITWGGPIAAFRWDNADNVDVKWLSIREIVAKG